MQRHVLSVLVENEPGVLSRVVGLFSGRGFNIDSLNVAPALEDGTSHMTITTYGDSMILEQIMKQLHKIVSVIKVVDVSPTEMTIEATGNHEKLEAILGLLQRFGLKEIARTGSVAMRRSRKSEG